MIFDTLENCKLYYGINPDFEKAFNFIKEAEEKDFSAGKYEIDGTKVYASVQEYTTKKYEDAKFEGHRRYIDIQYIVSGTECIEMADISKVTPDTEYDTEKDFELYKNCDKTKNCVLEEKEFGIFFPQDIHKPGISYKGEAKTVKKIVVKIEI